jgi:Zn-dependent protease with chaperone function
MSSLLIQRIVIGCALAVWLIVVAGGFVSLASYDQQAGAATAAPRRIDSLPAAAPQKHRLLMFVHPRCPCSTASLRELERLMARCVDELDTTVYFIRPAGEADAWAQGNLWDHANQIPGVKAVIDAGGEMAERFGAKTSGSVALYDAAGRLLYEGGITAARGHEGDNRGKDAVFALVRGEATPTTTCPVFGCSLNSDSLPGER